MLSTVGSASMIAVCRGVATRYAAALGAADVPVTLQVWPHMIHAWMMWNAKLADGRKALAQAGEFMQRWIGPAR